MSNFYIHNMEIGYAPGIVRLEVGRWDGEPIGRPVDVRELCLNLELTDGTIVQVASEAVAGIDWSGSKVGVMYFVNGANGLIEKPPQPSVHHVFNYTTRQWEDPRTTETEWAVVRSKRARLLLSCDWTQLPDVPPTTQGAWASYRQALRDITQQADPFNIVWPAAL